MLCACGGVVHTSMYACMLMCDVCVCMHVVWVHVLWVHVLCVYMCTLEVFPLLCTSLPCLRVFSLGGRCNRNPVMTLLVFKGYC